MDISGESRVNPVSRVDHWMEGLSLAARRRNRRLDVLWIHCYNCPQGSPNKDAQWLDVQPAQMKIWEGCGLGVMNKKTVNNNNKDSERRCGMDKIAWRLGRMRKPKTKF